MKITSETNKRLLKSITGGVLVGVLCISARLPLQGFLVLPWAVAVLPSAVVVLPSAVVVLTSAVVVPGYLTPLREVEWMVVARAEAKGGLAEAGGNTGEWAVCITIAGSTI